MNLCDSHCHLQDERLAPFLNDVMARARSSGVARFVCCGTSESDWPLVKRLAGANPSILPQYGLHPWYVANRSPDWRNALAACLEANPLSGLGEAGLDHAVTDRDDVGQAAVFRAQLQLAVDLHRPVSIHCRRAWGAMLDLLKEFGSFPAGLVFHSCSASSDLIGELVALGGYFSFSGSITFSGNKRGRRTLLAVPPDRVLIETDTPVLHPNVPPRLTDKNAKPLNEPANLLHVLRAVSQIREIDEQDMAVQLWRNTARVFPAPGDAP